jgi:hypothetical protein
MTTFDGARDEILAAFRTAWTAGTPPITGTVPPVGYEGVETAASQPSTAPFARIVIRHVGGRQATLSNQDGQRTFEKTGIIGVQIFAPLVAGLGLTVVEALAKVAKSAFEGRATPSGVWFRNVRAVEVGPDGAMFQINVWADFEYDELV